MGYIYKITNSINNKVYIGQTRQTIKQRWSGHKHSVLVSEAPLYRAMRKYGIENFQITTILECNNEQLNDKEIYYIQHYNSFVPNGYNATFGGKGQSLYDYEKLRQDYFNNNFNITKVCEINHCDYLPVKNALLEKGIQPQKSYSHLLVGVYELDKDNNILRYFNCYSEVVQYYNQENMTIKGLSDYLSSKSFNTYKGHYFCRDYDLDQYCSKSHEDKRLTKIKCVDLNLEFTSITEAAKWILENNSKYNTTVKNMTGNISRAIKRNIKAYGYKWSYL